MKIVNIDKKEQLNKLVGSQENSQFLQSWQWGEFHKRVSGRVWRLGVENNNRIIATATIIEKVLPMGRGYFYCPRGPILENINNKEVLKFLFDEIRKLAQEEGAMFFRFDPIFELPSLDLEINKTLDIQPSKTSILDLSTKIDDLIERMHQKTRYNIGLAEKKGVKIIEASLIRFEDFWGLMGETSGRDDFRTHGRDYYEHMLKFDKDFIRLFIAEYKGKSIAANIVSLFGDTITYIHGASGNDNRNLMAPYLLQWYAIKMAKEKGFKFYDFYGIDEEKWPGVTRFKKGFKGDIIEYPGTFDLVFDSMNYNIYKMVRKVRRTF